MAGGDDHPLWVGAVAAAAVDLYRIVREQERSVLVFIGTIFGLLVLPSRSPRWLFRIERRGSIRSK